MVYYREKINFILLIHSCVGAIANRGQWEQGCSLLMATDLGPVRATRKKKHFTAPIQLPDNPLFGLVLCIFLAI